jgi:hypothetical protein
MGGAIVGGAGQFPGQDEIISREVIAKLKGRATMVGRLEDLFGLAAPTAS